MQSFYEKQVPDAKGSEFTFVSVNGNFTKRNFVLYLMFFEGGINNQTLEVAGSEANLDTQYAFGLSYPIPVRIYVFYYLIILIWYITWTCSVYFLFYRREPPIHPQW